MALVLKFQSHNVLHSNNQVSGIVPSQILCSSFSTKLDKNCSVNLLCSRLNIMRKPINFFNMIIPTKLYLFLIQHMILIIMSLQVYGDHSHHLHHSLQNDRAALLAFKRTISFDPNATLSNWNRTTHVCNFTGVRCNKKLRSVTKLILFGTGLVGLLSPFISNLTGLRALRIVDSHLSGIIPSEFTSLYVPPSSSPAG